jgi:hypothetical protein
MNKFDFRSQNLFYLPAIYTFGAGSANNSEFLVLGF